jgi:hypothetical protein
MTAKVESIKTIVEESVENPHLTPMLASVKMRYSFRDGISGQYRFKELDFIQKPIYTCRSKRLL